MKILIIILLTAFSFQNLVSQKVKDEKNLVKIQLLSELQDAIPGSKFNIALYMKMRKGWHTYWRNAGDSGLPTEIEWDLPEGVKVGEIQWPVPKKINFDDLANYGYEDEVMLIVPIELSNDLQVGKELNIKAKVSWLVCKEVCISQDGEASTKIITSEYDVANSKELINEWIKKLPKKYEGDLKATRDGDKVRLAYNIPQSNYVFFPYEGGIFSNGAKQTHLSGDNWTYIDILLDNYRIEEPKRLYGLLVSGEESYQINVKIQE